MIPFRRHYMKTVELSCNNNALSCNDNALSCLSCILGWYGTV